MVDPLHIRNFCIIAHVDHGKSTLADRFIQLCGGLAAREMQEQVLDTMDLERERGITIKAQSVSLQYRARDGEEYLLNLIDTPGHVDFSYEVSRSLAACEGALLVVDATQGVEAQSVANCYMAIEQDLEVLPVLNKMDQPHADADLVKQGIEEIIGLDARDAPCISARSGAGVEELLELLVLMIPPPRGDRGAPLQGLIVDSWFDRYAGVVSLLCVKNGVLRRGENILCSASGRRYTVSELGVFSPRPVAREELAAGEVGFVVAGIRDIHGAPVGDTMVHVASPAPSLTGFERVQPRLYAGLFPLSTKDCHLLRDALEKLSLNDAALDYTPEHSVALGHGFRCGFLGSLHVEIVQERLEREYQLEVVIVAPTVAYRVFTTDGAECIVSSPARLPEASRIQAIHEPIVNVNLLLPERVLGGVIGLCEEKRGKQQKLEFVGRQVSLCYEMPLSEVIGDFFDRLKSLSRGHASYDYSFARYAPVKAVKLEVLINGEAVDALAVIIPREQADAWGRALSSKLKSIVPRQMFDVAIQASVGGRIIARETVKALRKDVTAKLYGGDVTRKRKLLDKQKAGKKRMKKIGQVSLPQTAFLQALHTAHR